MQKIDKDWIDSKMQARAESWFAKKFEPENIDLKENDILRQTWQRVANNSDWQNFKKAAVSSRKNALEEQLLDAITGVLDLSNNSNAEEQEGNSDAD